jgi:hypothetical protein
MVKTLAAAGFTPSAKSIKLLMVRADMDPDSVALRSMDIRAMPEISEPSLRTRTTLFKLRARQCRFVVSDDGSEALFCGGETQDGSRWCP